MKLLDTKKIWTGDGLGQSAAVTLHQLKRTPLDAPYPAALYERIQKNGVRQGYEVFIIKTIKKDTPLPNGSTVEESYERYPTDSHFGKTAWAPDSLERAEEIYENLVKGLHPCDKLNDPDKNELTDTKEGSVTTIHTKREQKNLPSLKLPDGEFSTKDLAEKNGVEYAVAHLFLKTSLDSHTVKFCREERRNAKGKLTKLYAKVEDNQTS
jgi:hypothetical protein